MKRTLALGLAILFAFVPVALATTAHVPSHDVNRMEAPQRPTDNPEYIEAKQNPHWCGTNEIWEMRKAQLGLYKAAAGCPQQGVCDDPAYRDGTVIEPLTVRVIVHVMGDNQGYVVDQATVDATITQMNADYDANGTSIQFTNVATRFHRDRQLKCIAGYTPGGGGWWSDIQKMKNKYAESPESQCNIYISCQDYSPWGYLLGVATFPWDPDALTAQGGLWLNSIACGTGGHTLTHEMGHCLGLWHTHHGVTEVEECGDCYEFADGATYGYNNDIRGDFAVDTDPTPVNYYCSPPGGVDCLGHPWGRTHYENYMGYGPDDCITDFSVLQSRRLQCWTKDALPGWLEGGEKPMWVQYINMGLESKGPWTNAVANLKVVEDEAGTGVGGVTVSGHWYGLTSDSDVFTTASDGTGSCTSDKVKNPSGEFCFQVDDLQKGGYYWDPAKGVISNCISTSAKLVGDLAAGEFSIINVPNPFNPETDIHYVLPAEAKVTLEVYNLLGQQVVTLVDEIQNSGYHIVHWNAADVPTGVYFYRITAGGTSRDNRAEFTATKSMILMK